MTTDNGSRAIRVAASVMAAACLLFAASPSRAAGEGRKAEEIVRAWGDAVVHVKIVLQVRLIADGREVNKSESEIEALGTVIDPSGLIVLSHTNIDASRIYGDLLKRAKQGGEGAPKLDIQIDTGAVKILLPDESEAPARIVLRDKDLDLAFVMPAEAPAKPMRAVDLADAGKPALLDEVLILGRLGEVAGRIPAVSPYRIEGVVRKPRTYYVIDQNSMSGRLGAPVFTTDGKIVGIFLLKVAETRGGGASSLDLMFGGIGKLGFYPVILPAEEVASIAKQAQDAKGEPKASPR